MSAEEKSVPMRVEDRKTDHRPSPSDRSCNPVQIKAETSSDLERLVLETINTFAAKGIAIGDMASLFRLKDALRDLDAEGGAASRERGEGQPASATILARACAIIDLLIQGGCTQEQAAQITARNFRSAGVGFPETGDDSRGWNQLLNWRMRLMQGSQPDSARAEYLSFKDEIAKIPPEAQIRRVLDARLWDRRTNVLWRSYVLPSV